MSRKPRYLTPNELRQSDSLRGQIYCWQEEHAAENMPFPSAEYRWSIKALMALERLNLDAGTVPIPKG